MKLLRALLLFLLLLALIIAGIWAYQRYLAPTPYVPPILVPPNDSVTPQPPITKPPVLVPKPPQEPPPILIPQHVEKILASVYQQTKITKSYDPSYVGLEYPGGDVPMTTGVCSDVVIRAFRANGVDLQKEVHEDMRRNFKQYPKKWGLKRPDKNIDHRRVYNLMRFFERQGKSLPVSNNPQDYQPGDVVAWDLGTGQAHIGVVTHLQTAEGVPLIGHNVAYGTNIEDALFFWPILGHYRYFNAPEDVNVKRPDHTTIDLQQ